MDFDPSFPPTSNSLNRLRLASAGLPYSLHGKLGYELLSSAALTMLIQPYTDTISTFYEQVALETDWAIEIAHTLGIRLGGLLFVLARADAETREANPDKPTGYWTHWSGIRTIYLGGGMVSSNAGAIIAAQAQATLQTLAHDPGYQVVLAHHAPYLPLLGAARIVQKGMRAIILDFGGTYVKRAIAHYTAAALSRLQILAELPSDFPAIPDDSPVVFERIVNIIVQAHTGVDAPVIPISIAAYVTAQGQPLLTQSGIYMQLARLTLDVPAALSRAVSHRLGVSVEVRLLHDASAAALYYAPEEAAAVILLGTALGSGYPVARRSLSLCRISPALVVQ